MARLVERDADLRHLGARRLQSLEPLGHDRVEPARRLGELARLALAVDHPGGERVPLPARDAPVAAAHHAVEGDERRGDAGPVEPIGRRAVAHDEHVADERAHERLVLGRVAQRVGQSRDDALVGRRRPHRAGDVRRHLRDDRRPPLAARRQRLEQGHACVEITHDHVLQPGPERGGERLRVLGGGLEVVGDEARHARVALLDERLHAGADALEARLHLLERVEARAGARELALGLFEGPLADDDRRLELAQALLEARLLGGARDAACAQVVDRAADLLGARGVLDPRELEGLAHGLHLGEPGGDVGLASLEARQARLGARDLRLARRDRAAEGIHARGRRRERRGPLDLLRVLGRGPLGVPGLFLREGRRLARHGRALLFELRRLLGHRVPLALRLLLALGERRQPVLAPLDRSLLGADGVVGRERRARRRVERALGREDLEPPRLEPGLARLQLGPRLLVRLAEPRHLGALEADPADELEVLVGRLVKVKVLELVPVRHVALGLGGLARERREAPLDLGDDVPHPEQVLLGELHLLLGLLLPGLELGDAGRLFDEQAPVLGLRAHDEADLALLDDRIGLRAGAGAEEEIRDVAEPDRGLVDEVIAVAAAVQAAGHGDLGVLAELEGDLARVVVLEGERDLGEVVRGARVGAVEDDVLHAAAAEVLRALLAHAPADGVDDVRLAAAVGADDAEDVVVEVDDRAVDERLEPDHLKLLDLHPRGLRARPSVTSHRVTSEPQVYPVRAFRTRPNRRLSRRARDRPSQRDPATLSAASAWHST